MAAKWRSLVDGFCELWAASSPSEIDWARASLTEFSGEVRADRAAELRTYAAETRSRLT